MRHSELVYKSKGVQGTAYVPAPRLEKVNQVIMDSYVQHVSMPVRDLIQAVCVSRGKVIRPENRRSVYETVEALWSQSEFRKAQILAEMKELRDQYPDEVLGFRKSGNKVITLNIEKGKELVALLARINRVINAAFQPKSHKFTQLSNREVYKAQLEIA